MQNPSTTPLMTGILIEWARSLATSPVHDAALYLLGNIPGFPPVIQTVHILCVAVIMGSVVMINLRMLRLAVPSQRLDDMVQRLMPWMWWALPLLALSGMVLVAARPLRYATNPVFAIKYLLLLPAVALAALVHIKSRRAPGYWEATASRRVATKLLAAASMLLWTGVVLAGRWIAYADYLFPPEE